MFAYFLQEAAAIHVLHKKNLHDLQVGDTFVVCDAGGGTVDLISYTIVKLDPVIEVKEAAPGTGALCGNTYLNRRFKEYLQSRLSHLPSWDDEVLSEAMDDFETRVRTATQCTTLSLLFCIDQESLLVYC